MPKIAIVGRPNVGKSALFNRICKQRIAIVDEAEGVTRDRLYAESDLFGRPFTLIDTAGIDEASEAAFSQEVITQAKYAIQEADALVFVVDGEVGITPLDRELAHLLHQQKKPLVMAVNKADSQERDLSVHQFYPLGIQQMVPVSATQGRNIAELLEGLMDTLPTGELEEEQGHTKVAIIGRTNVGKSTLVNTLLGDERCIASPLAGTTRDAIDVPFQIEGRNYLLIDTAGLRRKRAEKEVVDKFAALRTGQAIARADVCVLMLDSTEGMTAFEKRIAAEIEEAGKGCVVLFNKWDLVQGYRMEHSQQVARDTLPFLRHCPMVFGSAKTGRNLPKILSAIDIVAQAGQRQFATADLNRFIERTMQQLHPPMIRGKRLRIYYMTQISKQPLKFLLFVNYPFLMDNAYKRYLYNQFREQFEILGTPIVFQLRGKKASSSANSSREKAFS